jgi:hypothetical protein
LSFSWTNRFLQSDATVGFLLLVVILPVGFSPCLCYIPPFCLLLIVVRVVFGHMLLYESISKQECAGGKGAYVSMSVSEP